MTARRLSVAFACALGAPALARADAELTIEALGSAFVDTTRATPIGGNPGRTLGEQRLFALQRAVAIWERALDSKVPIVVQIRFQAFGCEEDGTVLAGASPGSFVRGEELSTATPELWFPGALADRLAGRDLSPGEPDLIMRVNSSLDDECRGRMGAWYYGFDGAGQENDLIEVILHELAHGLGFVSLVDPETGEFELAGEEIDAFSARIVDLDRNESWARLDAAERAASAAKPHRAAWDGDETRRATARFSQAGRQPTAPGAAHGRRRERPAPALHASTRRGRLQRESLRHTGEP